jgi:hypothetical protein
MHYILEQPIHLAMQQHERVIEIAPLCQRVRVE